MALAIMGLSISGWPEGVPFPQPSTTESQRQTRSSKGKAAVPKNKGLKSLRAHHVHVLLSAFENKKTRPVFHRHDVQDKDSMWFSILPHRMLMNSFS